MVRYIKIKGYHCCEYLDLEITHWQGLLCNQRMSYAQILFSLNETTGHCTRNNIFIHSQILVTDQIRDAITAEALLLLSLIRKTM
jgi:hypothetical protein